MVVLFIYTLFDFNKKNFLFINLETILCKRATLDLMSLVNTTNVTEQVVPHIGEFIAFKENASSCERHMHSIEAVLYLIVDDHNLEMKLHIAASIKCTDRIINLKFVPFSHIVCFYKMEY